MFKIIVPALVLVLASASGHAWAANYSDPVEGIFKGVYGNTISIEIPSQVNKSPVTDADNVGDLSFQISSETGYRNFNQLTDLKYGDEVKVDYTDNPNAKIKQLVANVITKVGPADTEAATATTVPVNVVSGTPTVTQTVVTTTTGTAPQ